MAAVNLPIAVLDEAVQLVSDPEELVALAPAIFDTTSPEALRAHAADLESAVEDVLTTVLRRAETNETLSTAERVEFLIAVARAFIALFQVARDVSQSEPSLNRETIRALLVDIPVLRALRRDARKLTAILDLLGVITLREDTRGSLTVDSRVHWESLDDLVSDPLALARAGCTDDGGAFDLHKAISKTYAVLRSLGIDVALRQSTSDRTPEFRALATSLGYNLRASSLLFETVLVRDDATGSGLRALIIPFYEASTDSLALGVTISIDGEATVPIGDEYEVLVRLLGRSLTEASLLLLPSLRIERLSEATSSDDFGVEVGVRRTGEAEPISLFQDELFRIGVAGVEAKTALSQIGGDALYMVEAAIRGLSFQTGGASADGFIKKVASDDGMSASFDLTIGWSTLEGLYFRGSGRLELTIPIHRTLGPITVDTIYLAVEIGRKLDTTVAVSFSAAIGPVAVAVDRIGLLLPIELDGEDGPPIQVSRPKFKAPRGAGLAVMAGPVSGGGFMRHDEERGSYDGILDLKFGDIGLVAVALITTKLPGGRQGYALFINIGVTFSPPIVLPYNFNLQGCGGLLAINRTMDVEALRSGLRNRTLDSILFPENPILNANKIITDSERVFPIEEGRFVVGPMAKLGWGQGGLITADIAIVLELPSPIVIALLGQLKARVPKSEEAKVKLNLDVLGILDIPKKSLSFDASLYDSKLLVYELYGDAALRLRWGSKPLFAMSVGGFHPKFTPPPKFPSLRRLTLALSSGSSFEISCSVYHALTSNSLQFGAKLRLHAEACGAELDGHLGFDTLFIFSPFEFDVGISGGVGASYKGHNIASVSLSFDLSGPTPWHAKGKAKVSVLCWDVTARFNKTWGSDNKARVAKVDPLQPFLDEIALVDNWGAALLPRRSVVESLKSLEAPVAANPDAETPSSVTEPDFLAHPAGILEFRQRLLPLDMKLEKFGNAGVKDHDKFDVRMELGPATVATPSTDTVPLPDLTIDEVKEHFARGQFKDLSKSERLSKPSYEKFKAGVRVGPTIARIDGDVQPCPLEYESVVMLRDGQREEATAKRPDWSRLLRTIRIAGLRRNSMRYRRLGKFATGDPPRVGLNDEAYSIVDAITLMRATHIHPTSSPPLNQTQAEDLLEAAIASNLAAHGSAIVVPAFEEVA